MKVQIDIKNARNVGTREVQRWLVPLLNNIDTYVGIPFERPQDLRIIAKTQFYNENSINEVELESELKVFDKSELRVYKVETPQRCAEPFRYNGMLYNIKKTNQEINDETEEIRKLQQAYLNPSVSFHYLHNTPARYIA